MQIGARLRGGEVITLTSDVGGGKTTFTRGLASGIGSEDTVHSPSFTISNEYQGAQLHMYHLDFYRLDDAGIMATELAEYINQPDAVVVVEWPAIVDAVLPAQHIDIAIEATSETARRITVSYAPEQAYIRGDTT